MTRKKVKLEWIVNDSARKASLKKRRLGLLKKVSELITLCGIEAFIIIYSPDEAEPVTWPPSKSDVERLIMRYMSMPELERYKKLTNQESYLKERTGKVHDQSKKSHQKNKDSELSHFMFEAHEGKGLNQFEIIELYGFDLLVNDKMQEIRKRIEYFQTVPPVDERCNRSEDVDVGGGGGGGRGGGGSEGAGGSGSGIGALQGKMIQNPNEPLSWDQWFYDMVHNTDTNVAGGSSNFNTIGESETAFQNSPYGFEPYGPVDMNYDQHENIEPARMMMYPSSFELGGDGFGQFHHPKTITDGNSFQPVFPPPTLPPPYYGGSGGGDDVDMGMHGFYGGFDGVGAEPFTPANVLKPYNDGVGAGPYAPTSGRRPYNDGVGVGPFALASGLRPHSDGVGAAPYAPTNGLRPHSDGIGVGPYAPTSDLRPHNDGVGVGPYTPINSLKPHSNGVGAELYPPHSSLTPHYDGVGVDAEPYAPTSGLRPYSDGLGVGPYARASVLQPHNDGVSDAPSAPTNGLGPHNDGGNDQMGMSNYEVNYPQWPQNP